MISCSATASRGAGCAAGIDFRFWWVYAPTQGSYQGGQAGYAEAAPSSAYEAVRNGRLLFSFSREKQALVALGFHLKTPFLHSPTPFLKLV
jgi:hypothetical protein